MDADLHQRRGALTGGGADAVAAVVANSTPRGGIGRSRAGPGRGGYRGWHARAAPDQFPTSLGRSERVTCTAWGLPSCIKLTKTESPGRCDRNATTNAPMVVTGRPSMLTMMSPLAMPAESAGLCPRTCFTTAPP